MNRLCYRAAPLGILLLAALALPLASCSVPAGTPAPDEAAPTVAADPAPPPPPYHLDPPGVGYDGRSWAERTLESLSLEDKVAQLMMPILIGDFTPSGSAAGRVRAALVHDVESAEMARRHNDANVLALSGDRLDG